MDYRKYVKIEKKFYGPSEVESLLGNCRKVRKELGWKPKYNFKQLVEDMVRADLEFVEKEGIKVLDCEKLFKNFQKKEK